MVEEKAKMNCMCNVINCSNLCHLLKNQSFMATPHVLVCQLGYKFMSYESWSGNIFIRHIFWVLYFQL